MNYLRLKSVGSSENVAKSDSEYDLLLIARSATSIVPRRKYFIPGEP